MRIAIFLLTALPLLPQTPKIPRTADGKPDFSGIWQAGGISLNGEAGAPNNPLRNAPAARPATPAPKPEPAQFFDAAEAKAKEFQANLMKDDPSARCLLPGVPRINGQPFPLQFVQTPKNVVILYEAFRAYRLIPVDGSGHYADAIPSFMGDSAGHFEGDTLVVDVNNFNGKIWMDGRGHIASEEFHVVERWTHKGDTIEYEATLSDPKTLKKPTVQRLTFKHPPQTDIRLQEYECIDGNLDVQHLVGPGGK
jgi:hypothetical protein